MGYAVNDTVSDVKERVFQKATRVDASSVVDTTSRDFILKVLGRNEFFHTPTNKMSGK